MEYRYTPVKPIRLEGPPTLVRMAPPSGSKSRCERCGALVQPDTATERRHAATHRGAVDFRLVTT